MFCSLLIQAVFALNFHPTVSVLASGSKDCTVKFFDYSKPSVKRSYRAIQEVASVNCLNFHPSGDYMLVGTEQSTCELVYALFSVNLFSSPHPHTHTHTPPHTHPYTVRLYDVSTFQCFVSSDARDQHVQTITSVRPHSFLVT